MKYKKIFILFIISFTIIILSAKNEYTPKPPILTVNSEKISIPTTQGSYCWNGLLKDICVDMVSPPELINSKPIIVPENTSLKLNFSKKPKKNSITVNIWDNNISSKKVDFKNNILKVPKEKGTYIYDVNAEWQKGNSSYVFVIQIK
ncbi:hypothetical protein [Cytobacillus firmus]|uniref:hypothetical protein n=1 Tax=Cytobacillus firmus TaxID=1399 RepID=UPI0018CF12D5|nr:hypothetical protein [Cytobacillus firmus]